MSLPIALKYCENLDFKADFVSVSLYWKNLLFSNILGGPSIVFSRYHIRNKTKIRVYEFGEKEAEFCGSIIGRRRFFVLVIKKSVFFNDTPFFSSGFDCTAMYSGILSLELPCGPFVQRLRENLFIGEILGKKIHKKKISVNSKFRKKSRSSYVVEIS